jgi:hypothetical protein
MNGSVEALVQRLDRGALAADHEQGDRVIRPASVLAYRDSLTHLPQTGQYAPRSGEQVLAEERQVLAVDDGEAGMKHVAKSAPTTP